MNFIVAGSADYLSEGIDYLSKNGFSPEFIIDDGRNIIEFEKEIKNLNIELLVCLAYSNILKRKEINLFRKGCINLYTGLPLYRGRYQAPWMLI